MAVYYKFKSARDYDSIPMESQFISVATLKERIFETKHLGRGTDFDLVISNAQTNEEYLDESAMIPKNTSVLIRRVPGRPRMPIVAEPDEPKKVEAKVEQPTPPSNMMAGDSSTVNYHNGSEWDEFGSDLYAFPEAHPAQPSNPPVEISPTSKIDEENKIKALVETPALDWTRQGQDVYGGGRGFGRGMGGRMTAGRGFGRGVFERKTPPAGYICYRCKVPGHFIQHCPTNGDPIYDVRKVKAPTGIPKSMLMATPDGSYMLPSGAVAVLRPNEAAFDKEVDGLPSTRPVNDVPPEYRCPLCKELMKDAAFTGKCCFRSFCDKCIRDYLITKSMCICGATNILADDLIPNKTLRESIMRMLESSTPSTENVGSLEHVQDMQSARHVQPSVPSPTLSATPKDEPKQTLAVDYSADVKVAHVKEDAAASERKVVNETDNRSLDKKTPKNTDLPVATPESVTVKDQVSPESAPVPAEVQEKLFGVDQGKKKKKKKTRLPNNAADMQWGTYPDVGVENYVGMPMAQPAFNPYWNGAIPMGMDGIMTPFGGGMAVPYMGYAPGPFDLPFAGMMPQDPFGGMMPQDPFAAQGYMMQGFPPRDLSELGTGLNQRPPMSRGEFEAMKADIRKKREIERHNEREYTRDGRVNGREVNNSVADDSSMKAKPGSATSEADRFDRPEWSERPTIADRRGTSRQRSRLSPSPPRAPKISSEGHRRRDNSRSATAEAGSDGGGGGERKQKGSVFHRISFPGEDGSKKRKVSSSEGPTKDRHHGRSSKQGTMTVAAAAAVPNGYGRESSYGDRESSEEEEYHFKRRPSSSRKEREEEDGRRGHSARGSRDRGHERAEGRRR